jgi:hypothetical protein
MCHTVPDWLHKISHFQSSEKSWSAVMYGESIVYFFYKNIIITSNNVRVYKGIISWSVWLKLQEKRVINYK